jgi:hypothetical protein
VSWLGVAVEEAPEALQAQLGLKKGEGLVVTTVASNSPAATAELRKFDLLAEFDGQMLVDPVQLRKLVQMHAEGDTVNLAVYRGGKKMTVSAKLAMTTWDNAALEEDGPLGNLKVDLQGLNNLTREIDLKLTPELKAALDQKKMRAELERATGEQQRATIEVKRAMENADHALRRAMKDHPDQASALASADADLAALANNRVWLDTDASVVVKKDLKSAKSMVKTDDTGVYIIVANPAKRLTARDRAGKILFDGSIETPGEQSAVPKEVWEKVKPMIDQLGPVKPDQPQSKIAGANSNS